MKTLISAILAGISAACFALDPVAPVLPLAPPQPVLVIQQTGQLVITDRNPQPAVIVQQQGQQFITTSGQVLMPLNLQQKEGGK